MSFPQHSFLIKTIISRQSETKSVLDVSRSVFELLVDLSKIDSLFSKFEVTSFGDKSCSYEVHPEMQKSDIEKIASTFAQDIIDFARDEIAQLDNETNPTLDFQRPIGFNHFLQFGEEEFPLTGNFGLGSSLASNFNFKYVAMNSYKYFTFEWYENVIKCMVNHFDPVYSSLLFSPMQFYDETKEMNLPEALGWISYFKDDAEITLPDTLPDMQIEKYINGKIALFSRDEDYYHRLSKEERREKLLSNMKLLSVTQ